MASKCAADDAASKVVGCVLFSYPLHPPDNVVSRELIALPSALISQQSSQSQCPQAELRDAPLCSLSLPVLFIRGSRDEYSTEGPFKSLLERMTSSDVQVHEVSEGGHKLGFPKSVSQAEQDHSYKCALQTVAAFVNRLGSRETSSPSVCPRKRQKPFKNNSEGL